MPKFTFKLGNVCETGTKYFILLILQHFTIMSLANHSHEDISDIKFRDVIMQI